MPPRVSECNVQSSEVLQVAVLEGGHMAQHQLLRDRQHILIFLTCHSDQRGVTSVHRQVAQGVGQAGHGDEQQVGHVQAQVMQVGAFVEQYLEETCKH